MFPSFSLNNVCLHFTVIQMHPLNCITSYGRHRGKPAWQWFLPVTDPPNRWNTLHCLYWARRLETNTHPATISVYSLLKIHAIWPLQWQDTYYCKVGVETWGSSTGDPQSDPLGRALNRKDSGYLLREKAWNRFKGLHSEWEWNYVELFTSDWKQKQCLGY